MSRLIVSMWITLDGFVAGPHDSMDWLRADPDLMDYELGLVEQASALLLGRVTHSDSATHWPAVAAGEVDSDEANMRYARRLDQLDKIVVSRSGDIAAWPQTRLVEEVTADEIQRIKDRANGDVVVYGSLSLIKTLSALKVIDELHLVVNPVLLCNGKPLLDTEQSPVQLDLLECRPFSSGAVLLRYTPSSPTVDESRYSV